MFGFYSIVMGLVIGLLWEPLQDAFSSFELPEALTTILPGADLTTPAGWANAEFLSMIAPGGMIALAIMAGLRATAKEEESKTLGMSLSAPVSRNQFLAAKTLSVVSYVLIMGVLIYLGLLTADISGSLELSSSGMIAAAIHTTLLGLVFAAITLTVGVATGRAKPTMGIAALLAVLSFVVASFFPLSETLNDWTKLSPWFHYNGHNPLVEGVDVSSALVLGIAALVIGAIGFLQFPRRDLHG
ncbi:ABC transporter permease subunit [Corynebacterium alimapuense]|nr:ABC transporter permease subunit [Corynebacterium alimapuense]